MNPDEYVTQDRGKNREYRVSGFYGSSNEAFISFIRRMCMAAEVTDLKGLKKLVKNIQKDVSVWKRDIIE